MICEYERWEKKTKELEEVVNIQFAKWFEKVCKGEYELGVSAFEPSLTLREIAEINQKIEIYKSLSPRKPPEPIKRRIPSVAEIKSYIAKKFERGLTFVIVSYHTNPLFAIRERVLEEEGIEIDTYDQGGQGIYQERLAYKLASKFDCEVFTFTLGRSYLKKERYLNIHPNAPVIPIPYVGPLVEFVEDRTGLIKKENLYFVIDDLVEATLDYLIEKGIEVDVFSGHYAEGVAAARRLRKCYLKRTGRKAIFSATTHSLGWDKFVNTYYEYSPMELGAFNFDRRLMEERKGFQEADLVITVSPTETEVVKRVYGAKGDKVVSIPGGVDTELFRPFDPRRDGQRVEALRKKHGISSEDRLIMMVGRLWDYKRKGVDIAIDVGALVRRRVPNLKLVLVGLSPRDHPEDVWRAARLEVEALLHKNNLWEDSVLVEMVPHHEIPTWLQLVALSRGLVLAIPRVEPWGLANLEAMAVGNVVVTIDEGGPPHYIENGKTGILVNRRNIRQITERVVEVLKEEDYARKIRENASLVASREHSWEGVARRFLWAHFTTISSGLSTPRTSGL
jgi:glycosyltransferase involved in cell wall biosynthesis